MSENEQTYMIDVSGQISGPHSLGDLVRLREQDRLPDDTKLIYPEESWSQATELRSSPKLLSRLHQLRQSAHSEITLPPIPAERSHIVDRYTDAYRVGGAIVALGTAIQVIGGVLAGLVFVASRSSGNGPLGAEGLVVGIFLAVVIGGVAWILGVIVKAQGQILRATLDTAVANSPFLTNQERAEAMGLPRGVADRTIHT